MIFRELFYLHKSDRKVVLLLLSIAAVALLVIEFTATEPATETPVAPADSTATAAPQQAAPFYADVPQRHIALSPFDPNTADSTQLLRLGLQPWQVRNIYKYRAAGGIYRTKTDFARLYGLTVKQYRELEPYIRISADYLPAST